MFGLIRKLHQDLGLTVLIVEHYVKAVLDTCDLVHVLAEGAVMASGTPAEIAANPEVRDRYLGTRMEFVEGQDLWDVANDRTVREPNRSGLHDGAGQALPLDDDQPGAARPMGEISIGVYDESRRATDYRACRGIVRNRAGG